jgi:hypothetical protein
MATMLKYSLENIQSISKNNFEFIIPENTLNLINYLTKEVGHNIVITNSLYKSKCIEENDNKKKKKNNRSAEISKEEWESLRTFKTTKFEEKQGIENEIDQIRLNLNKLTDKSYNSIKDKIIKNIENILLCENVEDYHNKISILIYEISSNNKFYSKIFADLYKELLEKYDWLKIVFEEKYNNYITSYDNLEYVEPNDNYDRYCELNKLSETRKSQSLFYVNLVKNGYLKPLSVYKLLRGLLDKLLILIHMENKKNEVDDIVENIALLFDKDIIEEVEDNDENDIQGFQLYPNGDVYGGEIFEFIRLLSECKVNNFKSLTNKSLFKFMDLVDL